MVIQSKKVWLADQFVPAAIEVNDGRITAILPYGTTHYWRYLRKEKEQ